MLIAIHAANASAGTQMQRAGFDRAHDRYSGMNDARTTRCMRMPHHGA